MLAFGAPLGLLAIGTPLKVLAFGAPLGVLAFGVRLLLLSNAALDCSWNATYEIREATGELSRAAVPC